jgi:hypothetical protein
VARPFNPQPKFPPCAVAVLDLLTEAGYVASDDHLRDRMTEEGWGKNGATWGRNALARAGWVWITDRGQVILRADAWEALHAT